MKYDIAKLMKQNLENNRKELKKYSFYGSMLPLLFTGCNIKGVNYNHFFWYINGTDIVVNNAVPCSVEYDRLIMGSETIHIARYIWDDLSMLTVDESLFQGTTSLFEPNVTTASIVEAELQALENDPEKSRLKDFIMTSSPSVPYTLHFKVEHFVSGNLESNRPQILNSPERAYGNAETVEENITI
jgi:hypothetical protein